MTTQAAPPVVLAIAYWLHMLATVVWIGGLVALAVFFLPTARQNLAPADYSNLLAKIQNRLQMVGWFSLAVLTVTGLFQMSSHPAYQGFLAINNTWAVAILIKHLVIGLMVLISAYLTWGVLPAMQRLALIRASGKQVDEAATSRLERRESRILTGNLVLSVLVLLLTALARASG
jgi:uncharacterized membrane protein